MGRYDKYTPTHILPKLTGEAKSYQIVATFLAQKINKEDIARLAKDLKDKGDYTSASAFRLAAGPFRPDRDR